MAIQVRRGNYADLDTSRLVQGEPFITLDEVGDNYYVGMAIGPSNTVRLATYDDLTDIKQDCIDARDEAVEAAENAASSESDAETAAENAETYWGYVDEAVNLVTPEVTIDFATGNLIFTGSQMLFWIDSTTGDLMWNVAHG